jgi:hypothetical protein
MKKLVFYCFALFSLVTFVISEELESQTNEKALTNYELALEAFENDDNEKAIALLHIASQEHNDFTSSAFYELGLLYQVKSRNNHLLISPVR